MFGGQHHENGGKQAAFPTISVTCSSTEVKHGKPVSIRQVAERFGCQQPGVQTQEAERQSAVCSCFLGSTIMCRFITTIFIQSVPRSKHSVSVIKTSQLMLYREIIAVSSHVHTKHINTAVWAERGIVNVKLAVHIVTTGL